MLESMFQWSEYQKEDFRSSLGSLFLITDQKIQPFHLSLIDWLTDAEIAGRKKYYVSLEEGHKKLADFCWGEYKDITGKRKYCHLSHYTLLYLPEHLIRTELWDNLETVLTDLRFIETKCSNGLLFNLITDYNSALYSMPEAQKEIKIRKKNEENVSDLTDRLILYANKSNKANNLHIQDQKRFTIQKNIDPKFNPLTKLWTEYEIKKDIERILKNPTRIDRIRAFSKYVNSESHALSKYSSIPGFCIQQAYNLSKSGPIGTAAKTIIDMEAVGILFLKTKKQLPPYNPHPVLMKTINGHDTICSVGITFDGKKAVSGSYDKTVCLWNLETGKCLQIMYGHKDCVRFVCISPNGSVVLSGSDDKTIRIWNPETGENLGELTGHTSFISCVNITPDGNKAISGSWDKNLIVWDIKSKKCIRILKGHTDRVNCVFMTYDGKLAFSGSWDKTIRVWEVETGKCLWIMKGHKGFISCISSTINGQLVLSGSSDKTLRIWNIETRDCVKILEGHTDLIQAVSITPFGELAITGSWDKTIKIWDIQKGKCLKTLMGHNSQVNGVAITPDGKTGVSGSSDKTIRIWNIEKGYCLKKNQHLKKVDSSNVYNVFENKQEKVNCIYFTGDGKMALLGDCDKSIRVLDLQTKKTLALFKGHGSYIKSLIVSPDGKIVVSGSMGGTLRIWNIAKGQCIHRIKGHAGWINCIAITPDGRHVLTGSYDKTVRMWDIETKKCNRIFQGHEDWVESIIVSPDAKKIISGGCDRTIRIWDVETGKTMSILERYGGYVESINVSPDSKTIVEGSNSGALRTWDIETGQCLQRIKEHTGSVNFIAITFDGKMVLSASEDGSICLCSIKNGISYAFFQDEDPILSLSLLLSTKNIVYGTKAGKIRFLKCYNLQMSHIITTPTRLWLFGSSGERGKWDDNITALCEWCGERFVVDEFILNTIREINMEAIEKANQTTIETIGSFIKNPKLPDSAWKDPRLLSQCPKCNKPLRFNPFIVDNK